ncbi:2,3-bisphosphoglycerate-independent phosphoglycerate mutase [Spatholobus suberectus]|nr:2,3-bisphosphoglycerate-independent phosphoglycerate mutase [Spatholobus suberectus]
MLALKGHVPFRIERHNRGPWKVGICAGIWVLREQVGGIYVVTADHGNAEDMVKRDKSGKPLLDKNGNIQILTSHTLQPVPIAIGGPGLSPGVRFRNDPNGGLANVAATVMNLHGFEAPSDYEPTLVEVVDN